MRYKCVEKSAESDVKISEIYQYQGLVRMVDNPNDFTSSHQFIDKKTSSASSPFHLDVDLCDDFWASVEYCGFLRCTYEPGTLTMTGLFMNEAYARLAGLDREEMARR